jgi:hypothetical protein
MVTGAGRRLLAGLAAVASATALVGMTAAETPAVAASAGSPIMFGAAVPYNSALPYNSTNPNGAKAKISAFETQTGRKMSALRLYYNWNQINQVAPAATFPDAGMKYAIANNELPVMSVRPLNNGTPISYASIAAATNNGTDAVSQTLDKWADAIKALNVHVLFTFSHEPETGAVKNNGTPADFIAAWRNIVTVFQQRGVTNAEYNFIATAYGYERKDVNAPGAHNASVYYPGDAWVDDISVDAYNWYNCRGFNTPWRSLASIIESSRQFIANHPTVGVGTSHTVRALITEFGSAEDPAGTYSKAQWYTDAENLFKNDPTGKYANYRLVMQWNNKGLDGYSNCDFTSNSSASALTAFNAFANDPAYAGTSLIPTTVPTGNAPLTPSGVTAWANDSSATVSWNAPGSTDPQPTSYTINGTDTTAGPAISPVTTAGSATSTNITGLINGHSYTFTVTASNAAGNSSPSGPTQAVTPTPAPPVITGPTTQMPSVVPSSLTPNILGNVDPSTGQPIDTEVDAITQVGNTVVVGGNFQNVAPAGTWPTTSPQPYIVAFDATTGAINTAFAPVLDNQVLSLLPGPDGQSVYVGGKFSKVNGVAAPKLALLNLSNGTAVPGFKPPSNYNPVTDLATANGHLLLGGLFTTMGGQARAGLASLNPTTGALDSYLTLSLSGHHNSDNPALTGAAAAPTGVTHFAVSPDGSRLAVIGNFTAVSGVARDQIALINLGDTPALANWSTSAYSTPCAYKAFDSFVRDVAFSNDGSFFAVAATGGQSNVPTCPYGDAVTRFEAGATGSSINPTWAALNGQDTLDSVAISGNAVYVGGHERWFNNNFGHNAAGAGAVPRPGIAALDATNGLPLAWNPGRNPRGVGAKALYVSSTGLWMGSDTEWIGNYQYHRGRIAFFPFSGGNVVPAVHAGSLPGPVYLAGSSVASGATADSLSSRSYDGSTAGPTTTLPAGGMSWSGVTGAFMLNGTLFYATSDNHFYQRTFDGSSYGPATAIDPYNDPTWDGVWSGVGTVNYDGLQPNFYTASELSKLTGIFYSNGSIYYTLSGSSKLYTRTFTPDSAVIGAVESTVPTTINFSTVSGMFTSGGYLYYATRADGNLHRVAFSGGSPTGTQTVVSGPGIDGNNWTTNAMFLSAN